jgi:exonuclease III
MQTLLWNCRGASTVPDWNEVISEAGEPDLLMLAETHVLPDAEFPEIDGYDVVANVPRSDRFIDSQSRGSRGIAVLVRSGWRLHSSRLSVWRRSERGTHIWLRVLLPEGQMGGALFLCLAYLPPPGSIFWSRGAHEADVFQKLEDDIAEAKLGGEVLIAGDLNARIGIEKDWVDTSDIEYHAGVGAPDAGFQLASLNTERCSADKTIDACGRVLLQLLKETGFSVLNGREGGDEQRAITSIHSNGNSVIDLYMASAGVAEAAERLEVLEKLRGLSDHRPVLLTIAGMGCNCESPCNETEDDGMERRKKLRRVTQEERAEFVRVLRKQSLKRKMEKVAAGEIGVDEGATLLQEVLIEAEIAAFGVAKEQRGESGAREFPVNEWFDLECKDARRGLKEALRREGSAVAEELRKKYRVVIWQKKRMFSKARTAQLLELAKRQPAKSWGRFKKLLKRVGFKARRSGTGIARGCTQGRCLREEGVTNGERRQWMERIWREKELRR